MGGKVWLVTGASRGLGLSLARELIAQGETVAATARNAVQLKETLGAGAMTVSLDVTRPGDITSAVRSVLAEFGRIDVLVNNAGYGYLASVEDAADAAIRAQFETNFFGAAAMMRTILPTMREQGSGVIVNISSAGGFAAAPGFGYYCASKFALEGLSEALALEAAEHGIKVMIVEPGPFRTDWAGSSLQVGEIGGAYEHSAGATLRRVRAHSGQQLGDPCRAARMIVEAVSVPSPPLRLLLGNLAVTVVDEKLKRVGQELDGQRGRAGQADYPR